MHRLFAVVSLITILVLAVTPGAKAQSHSGYCDAAESTADALDCVNRNKNDVQTRLQGVYDQLSTDIGAEQRKSLEASQQAWVAYRDAQCKWERSTAENPSLERIYELSCITLLTNMRTELLSMTLDRQQEDSPREFGAQPRWMNVLAHDYADVFWRYGSWIRADLDCDNENEQVLAGIEYDRNAEPGQKPRLVIAVSENPRTGRPTSTLLKIDLKPRTKNEEDNAKEDKKGDKEPLLCSPAVDFALISDDSAAKTPMPAAEDDAPDGAEDKNSCAAALRILDHICAPVDILWENGAYKLRQHNPDTDNNNG